LVQPILFRILCSYLDQGISIWAFPAREKGFLSAIKEIEKFSASSFFRSRRTKNLLFSKQCNISNLMKMLVGDESLFGQYLFDQQFGHMGWSGMVAVVEGNPSTLLDTRIISLHDLIIFELLLEIDAMDYHFGEGKWAPLASRLTEKPGDLFDEVKETELHEVLSLWQDAYEWSYYDQVLAGIKYVPKNLNHRSPDTKTFQSLFCIDDREDSLRRHLEKLDPLCETFATPGFFSMEFFYQPEDGKFLTKVCPAPMTPKYLIKGSNSQSKRQQDIHFSKHATSFYSGWLFSQTLGFWSALKLFINIFRPSSGPATALSFQHMDRFSDLTIENQNPDDKENGLQIGFTVPEMAQRLEAALKIAPNTWRADQLLAAVALVVATTILMKMGKLRWIWVTLLPMGWLVTITMTASYQKIFDANPRIGFLAYAKALAAQIAAAKIPAEKIAETQRLIFNQRLDAVVTGVLAVMILVLIVEALAHWYSILSRRKEIVLHESPYVATRWASDFSGTAHGDD